jgi:hypothetical protein
MGDHTGLTTISALSLSDSAWPDDTYWMFHTELKRDDPESSTSIAVRLPFRPAFGILSFEFPVDRYGDVIVQDRNNKIGALTPSALPFLRASCMGILSRPLSITIVRSWLLQSRFQIMSKN